MIKTTDLVGGGLPRLAPDLTWPATATLTSAAPYTSQIGIDISSALTPVLSLTGKYIIQAVGFKSVLSATNISIKLTIDGVVIWNDTAIAGETSINIIGDILGVEAAYENTQCNDSFLLEVQQVGATSATLSYAVRPIL